MLLLLLLGSVASAQFSYYGKNKVQTREYRFQSYETEHFRVLFYPGGEAIAEFAARSAEEYYRQLANELGFDLDTKVPLLLYLSPGQFAETNVILDIIEEGVGGFSELLRNRIVVPYNGSYRDLHHVIGHELAHIFQFRMFFRSRLASLLGAVDQFSVPLWVLEGFAEYASGWVTVNSELFMRDLVTADRLVPLHKLSDDMGYLLYREGESFFWYVDARYGRRKVFEFLTTLASKRNLGATFQAVFGTGVEQISNQWERSLKKRYWSQAAQAGFIDERAEKLTDHVRDGSVYNTAPAVSPSGLRLAFVSDRSEYADIYVMSTLDGSSARRLVRGGRSGGLENMPLLRPGVAWSPDEQELAFTATVRGRDYVTIVDANSGRVRRKIGGGLDAVYTPSYAPNGESLAFVGVKNSFSDIYVVRSRGGEPVRLTYDIYEDRDPVFSTGGDSVFFVSDRPDPGEKWVPGSYAVWCRTGNGRLDRLTSRYAEVSRPAVFGDLLVWSRADSFSTIEVFSLAERRVVRRAQLLGAVSNLSVSRDGATLAFSLFNNVGWDIALIRSPNEALPSDTVPVFAADSGREFVKSGLDFSRVRPVRFSLSLDYAVGAASYSPGAPEGLTGTLQLAFSDLLGNHRFEIYTDLYGDVINSNFYVAYWLLPWRVDYSVAAFQYQEVPFVSYDVVGLREYIVRVNRGLNVAAQYPFNKFFRAELGISGYVSDTVYGRRQQGGWVELPGRAFVSFMSPALVFDNTYWTSTGPARGVRARLSSDLTLLSDRHFVELALDARNYQRLGRRSVLATRLAAVSSWGPDGGEVYIGGENVRGYNWAEFYEQRGRSGLLGSMELRFPFIDRVKIAFPLPLEFGGIRGVGFLDGGIVLRDSLKLWDSQQGRFDALKLGVGAGLRVQISYFLLKLDWARPLSVTDDKGWKFIFGIGTDF